MDLCQWLTPPGVAYQFLQWAKVPEDGLIVNPAAGEGSLVPDQEGVVAVEIDSNLIPNLRYWRPKARIICNDFLETEVPQLRGDLGILNPPYANNGEGTFIRRTLLWTPRACALVRTLALHGKKRFDLCWRYVQPTRIAILTHRPQFLSPGCAPTVYKPEADYMAIECVNRLEPLPEDAYPDWVSALTIQWVNWR